MALSMILRKLVGIERSLDCGYGLRVDPAAIQSQIVGQDQHQMPNLSTRCTASA
jgi:hypothetical protein